MFQIVPEDPEVYYHTVHDEMIDKLNPERILYQICIQTTDYVEFGKPIEEMTKKTTGRIQRKHWKAKRVYCFMTYFPFSKFFFDACFKIMEVFRADRMKFAMQLEDNTYEKISESFEQEFFLRDRIKPYLVKMRELPIAEFETQIELEMGRFGEVKYQLPSAENASGLETEWAAPIVCSYMPLNDLLHLASIVMLEKKVIFLSSNYALLSATLVTIHNLIKKFPYPQPIVFVDKNHIPSLEDSIALCGINQGYRYFCRENLAALHEGHIFVILREEEIFITADTTEIPDIELGDLRSCLQEDYEKLNKNALDTIIQYTLTPLGTESAESSEGSSCKRIIYKPTSEQSDACSDIIKTVQRTFNDFVLMVLPEKPKRLDLTNDIDVEAILKFIKESYGEEDLFTNEFLKTRTFCDFIEKHYQNTKSVEEELGKKALDKSEKIRLKTAEAKLKIQEMQIKRLKASWKISQKQERDLANALKANGNGSILKQSTSTLK